MICWAGSEVAKAAPSRAGLSKSVCHGNCVTRGLGRRASKTVLGGWHSAREGRMVAKVCVSDVFTAVACIYYSILRWRRKKQVQMDAFT